MDDNSVEHIMNLNGLTAPRVTLKQVEESVSGASYYVFPSTTLTVCCLTLTNGFNVIGESACASEENFNEDLGRRLAYASALNKIWPLEGYLLRQHIYEEQLNANS